MAGLITAAASITVSIISLIGVIITTRASTSKIQNELKINNAVQDERIQELTREVRLHNSFAERIPVIEQRITALEKNVFK
jgi:hypothetical protein